MNTFQSTMMVELRVEDVDCEGASLHLNAETISSTRVIRKQGLKCATGLMATEKEQQAEGPTEAFKVFEKSLKYLAVFGILIGIDLSYEWKSNALFRCCKSLIAIFFFLNIYTQLLHVYHDETKRTLEQFAMYGILSATILKLACYEKYFKNMTALNDSTYKICQQTGGSRGKILAKRLNDNHNFYILICLLVLLIIVLYLYFPMKSFIVDHQFAQILPMEIMFIDQSTKMGCIIANIVFLIFGTLGISFIAFVGLGFDITIMNYALRVDVLEVDIKELDELWSHASRTTYKHCHIALRNICQKYVDSTKYVAEIKRIYEPQLFLYFCSSYLSQILCLYQWRVNNWINGLAFVLGMFLEMNFYCMMGTKVVIENERLSYLITQSKWYTYDLESQTLILSLLNLSMNMNELWIGSFKPLSVLTATEITKSIYSYYTVMSEVL